MPIYPQVKTYKGGFYNNVNTSGQNDRKYNCADLRKPYNSIYTDGIKPDPDGTAGDVLKVSTETYNSIKVATGFAVVGGAWFENSGEYIIQLDNPSASTRYDCVIIRNDDTELVREPQIYIKSLNAIPTVNDLTRSGGIYEICIAYLTITPNLPEITDAIITDTRTEGNLCNVMSGVGAMVVRTYNNTVFSGTANQTDIAIGISQYDRTRDNLIVMVEGRTMAAAQYTVLNNSTIRLAIGLPVVGTRIDFQVGKNVNAAGANTVVQEVAYLTGQVTEINKKVECDYICNGINDNIQISTLVAAFIASNAVATNAQLLINVHGKFGASGKYNGDNWLVVGATSTTSEKRVIIDFADCERVYFSLAGNSTNNIFFGVNYTIKNLNLIVQCFSAACNVTVHASVVGGFTAENCKVNVVTTGMTIYAREGTHINCQVTLSSSDEYTCCLYPQLGSKPVVVIGGKYIAYTGSNAKTSAVFYAQATDTNAVIVAHGVSCPTVAKTGFYQHNCIKMFGGYISTFGLITALADSVGAAATLSETGTIPISKP